MTARQGRILLFWLVCINVGALLALLVSQPAAAKPSDFCARHPENRQCVNPTPSPQPSPTATAAPTATPAPTAAPTPTPTTAPTASPTPIAVPSGTVTYETQAWWREAGLNVPADVGAHIHVRATVPRDGVPIDGKVTIPVRITLHEARGSLSWFRMGTEDATLVPQTPISLGPCADCTLDRSFVVDLSAIPTGRHELRMSANNPDEDPELAGAQRMFQSSGFQVCVRSCTPSYRPAGVHVIARGWYEGTEYANAELKSAIGSSVSVRLGPGSGGRPTTFSGIYIDPDFHHGDAGIVVKTIAGPFTGNVAMPSLPSGPHRLVLVSSDGQNAGVLLVPFEVR